MSGPSSGAYRTLITNAKDDGGRADLVQEREWLRAGAREERDILRTKRLLRIASRYPTVLPPERTAKDDGDEDQNWVTDPGL